MANFKKILATASAAVTMFAALSASSLTASASMTTGDINNDNVINRADSDLLIRYILSYPVSINRGNADVNGDGTINVADVVRLNQMISNNVNTTISCTANSNTVLRAGQRITSSNGSYFAIMQGDGNFVVYYKTNNRNVAVWSTGTHNHEGSYLALQQDGNLVVYSKTNQALWNSRTSSRPFANYNLTLGNDGVLTITRRSDNRVIWRSGNYSAAREAQMRIKSRYEYSSIEEAAKDFIVAYNGMSVSQNREYGSTINKVGENRYIFRHVCWGALRGNSYTGDCGDQWIVWGDTVAYVHTHGRENCYANLVFSKADMDLVNDNSEYQYAYLGNARGEVYRYKEGQACSDYTKTGVISGTKIETNKGKYVDTSSFDNDITSRQNSGDGRYDF